MRLTRTWRDTLKRNPSVPHLVTAGCFFACAVWCDSSARANATLENRARTARISASSQYSKDNGAALVEAQTDAAEVAPEPVNSWLPRASRAVPSGLSDMDALLKPLSGSVRLLGCDYQGSVLASARSFTDGTLRTEKAKWTCSTATGAVAEDPDALELNLTFTLTEGSAKSAGVAVAFDVRLIAKCAVSSLIMAWTVAQFDVHGPVDLAMATVAGAATYVVGIAVLRTFSLEELRNWRRLLQPGERQE